MNAERAIWGLVADRYDVVARTPEGKAHRVISIMSDVSQRLASMRDAWEAWAATMPGIPADAKVSLLYGEAQMPRPSY